MSWLIKVVMFKYVTLDRQKYKKVRITIELKVHRIMPWMMILRWLKNKIKLKRLMFHLIESLFCTYSLDGIEHQRSYSWTHHTPTKLTFGVWDVYSQSYPFSWFLRIKSGKIIYFLEEAVIQFLHVKKKKNKKIKTLWALMINW